MARIGRMTNSITAIKPERLAQYAKDFNADRANLVAANAAVSSKPPPTTKASARCHATSPSN